MAQTAQSVQVITLDGLAATGKSALATLLGNKLEWNILHSGLLYRYIAFCALRENNAAEIDRLNPLWLSDLASISQTTHKGQNQIWVNGENYTETLQQEKVARMASILAQRQSLREDMIAIQRQYKQAPGLVAEGRDMASVIFPEAACKVFLHASVAVRAQRRYKQLIMSGNNVKIADIEHSIEKRDHSDKTRTECALKANGAVVISTDNLSLEQTMQTILGHLA